MIGRWWPTGLERRIALRYLRGQRGTRNASLQTVIAIGSITLGVSALVVVLGVMNGLRNDLRDRILTASPHMRVLTYGPNLRIDNWRNELKVIARDPEVAAVAPEVASQSLVQNAAAYPEGVFVSGLEPGAGTSVVVHLDSAMKEGDLHFKPTTGADVDGAVVIGARLSEHLSARIGDVIYMYAPSAARVSRITGTITPPRRWAMEVTGIFETGMYIYDNQYVMMNLATAQQFAGLDTAVSALAVRLKDSWRVGPVAARLQKVLGYPYFLETWQSKNSTLFSALQLEKLAMGVVIFFIMIVAAFNIVGTLTMVVAFKTREIGILQAMGLEARGVARVFLAQGAIVGLLGTGMGLVLGLVVASVVDKRIHINPEIYFIDRLPVHVEVSDVILVVIASVAVAILATIPPSRRASRLLPVEAIRAE